jgi:hypothetical protein
MDFVRRPRRELSSTLAVVTEVMYLLAPNGFLIRFYSF